MEKNLIISNRKTSGWPFARPSAGKINYEKKLLFVLTLITRKIPLLYIRQNSLF